MSQKFHEATTAAEWAICRDREMRIQNYNLQPIFNVQSLIVPQGRGGLTIKCHHSICCMLPPRIETGVFPHLHFLCLTDNAVPIVGAENSLQALLKNFMELCGKFTMAAVEVLPCMTFLGHNIGFPCGMQRSKVWQGISCFALVRFAIKISRSSTCSQEGS